MDPLITSALIGTGGNILGGLMGGGSDGIDVSENYRNALAQSDAVLRHDRLKYKAMSVGAKAAGIHPLYALGASSNFSPAVLGTPTGQNAMGDAIKSAAAGASTYFANKAQMKSQAPLLAAQVRATNASAARDEAAANLTNSQIARQAQAALVTQDEGLGATGLGMSKPSIPESRGVPKGRVEALPSPIISAQKGRPGVTAGKKPAFMEVVVGKKSDGSPRTLYMPYSEEGPFENMDPASLLGALLKNLGLLDSPQRNPKGYRQTRRGRRPIR